MKCKRSLFSTIFSSKPVKAKSVEFMLIQNRCNTIQKHVLHFEESNQKSYAWKNQTPHKTIFQKKKPKTSEYSLPGNPDLSLKKKKKKSAVVSCYK